MTLGKVRFLLFICTVLLAVGLFAPCMTVQPGLGRPEITDLLQFVLPGFTHETTVSIAGGIKALFLDGKAFVALIVLIFSVVFPLLKLGVLWASVSALGHGEAPLKELKLTEKLGKYSMVDIFVIALIVLAVKGLPGETSVRLRWGVFAFTVSVILSMIIPGWIRQVAARPKTA